MQKDGTIESLAKQSLLKNSSIYMQQIQQFLMDCNRTVQSILDRFQSHFIIQMKDVSRNGWLDFPREVFLTQEGDPADRKYMSALQVSDFLQWLQVDKTDELFTIEEAVSSRWKCLFVSFNS